MIVWVYIHISNISKTYCSFPVLGVLIHAIDWISHYDLDLYLLEWC